MHVILNQILSSETIYKEKSHNIFSNQLENKDKYYGVFNNDKNIPEIMNLEKLNNLDLTDDKINISDTKIFS
jgi:hypothetical protein